MPTEFDKAKENAPVHVAIIMDGNGRWAKERGKPRIYGHNEGAKRIREVLSAAKKAGVKFLTLYAFSSENWNRPPEEVSALMGLLVSSIEEYGRELVENRVRFAAIGELSALPPECEKAVRSLEERTADFPKARSPSPSTTGRARRPQRRRGCSPKRLRAGKSTPPP